MYSKNQLYIGSVSHNIFFVPGYKHFPKILSQEREQMSFTVKSK